MLRFVLISLALHMAALAWVTTLTPDPPATSGPLELTLLAPATAPRQPTPDERQFQPIAAEPQPPAQQQPVKRRPKPATTPETPSTAYTSKPAPPPAQLTTAVKPTPADKPETVELAAAAAKPKNVPQGRAEITDNAQNETTIAQIRLELQRQLSRYFRYPLLAKRRGWEGEVVVGLRILDDGLITDLKISRSSGHDSLDRSALRSLAKVKRLTGITGLMREESLEINVPVVYRLQQS